jgi:glycosyltransferase involved in cell wall biosynthesis
MRLPREKLLVIPNGIDLARFDAAGSVVKSDFSIADGRRVILFVGRLDRQKRPDWLVERMPAIFRELPDHDLVVVGDGPLGKVVARRAAELGVADRVHLVGWRPDVARFYAAADLLVLASAWEGMPNVVLEAMAASRPVVVTAVHGVAQILGDAAAEQVVPVDDPLAFQAAVVRIAGDQGLASSLGAQNRLRVARDFSIAATVQAYVDLYRSLLDG